MIRLGCVESTIFPTGEVSEKVLNILPESFKPYEEKGLNIIRNTEFKDMVERIEYKFIQGRDI